MAAATAHVLPEASESTRRRLRIGGCDASELAREYGTPAYVFAEDDLRARARAFKGALARTTTAGEVVFASKAFPCTAVLRVFAEEGLGCDVAVGRRARTSRWAPGSRPSGSYLHGNAKSRRRAGDGPRGRRRAPSCSTTREEPTGCAEQLGGGSQRVLLARVIPGRRADTHEAILTGQAGSKFGFEPGDAPR